MAENESAHAGLRLDYRLVDGEVELVNIPPEMWWLTPGSFKGGGPVTSMHMVSKYQDQWHPGK